MASAVALGLPAPLSSAIGGAIGEPPQQVPDEAAFVERISGMPDSLDLVVIGPEVAQPIRVAQRVRAANASVPLLIIAPGAMVATQRRLLRYAAFVGQDVQLISADDAAAVAELATDATRRVRERRRYRSSRDLLRAPLGRQPDAAASEEELAAARADAQRPRPPGAPTSASVRATLVTEASARLDAVFGLAETLAAVGHMFVPHLADVCLIDIVETTGRVRRLPPVHVSHLPADEVANLARYVPAADGPQPASEALRTYRAVLLPVLDEARLRKILVDDEHVAIAQRIGARSALTVPLIARGHLLGAITLIATDGRAAYTEAELDLATELARRAAFAVESARAYDAARTAADAERRAREDAEQAVRMRDLFVSIAAHELRTPVTALLARVQLALRQLDRGTVDAAALRSTLVRVSGQGQRLARLVEQLLDVSRIDAGRLELERESVDLVPLLRDAVQIGRDASPEQQWVIEAPAELHACVDAARIEQVMLNLLDNATRYAPRGSIVRVTLRRDGADVVLEVEDEGPGVPPAERERIFERFRQVGEHTGGLGLGLFVVREIVERHAGTIAVHDGANGRGSRFEVRLPAEAVDATARSGAAPR